MLIEGRSQPCARRERPNPRGRFDRPTVLKRRLNSARSSGCLRILSDGIHFSYPAGSGSGRRRYRRSTLVFRRRLARRGFRSSIGPAWAPRRRRRAGEHALTTWLTRTFTRRDVHLSSRRRRVDRPIGAPSTASDSTRPWRRLRGEGATPSQGRQATSGRP